MAYRLVHVLTNEEVPIGATIHSFRGEEYTLVGFTPKPPPSTGRVEVTRPDLEFKQEFYPGVFHLRIEELPE